MNRADFHKNLAALFDQQRQKLAQLKDACPDIFSPALYLPYGAARLVDDKYDGPYGELWADVDWTDRALEYILAEEYRYISGEFKLKAKDEKTDDKIGAVMYAFALCTQPFVKGMPPIEAPAEGEQARAMVLMTGTWFHDWYGEFTISLEHLEEMVKNYAENRGASDPRGGHPDTEMVVDYNHGSFAGDVEAAKAAGWVRGNGIYVVQPSQEERKAATARRQLKQPASAPKLAEPPPEPKGDTDMGDERIREVLGLSDDVEITNDHRTQALTKVDERNQELEAEAKAITEATGTEDLPTAAAALTEGKLPGRVVLAEPDHAVLVAATAELKALKKGQEGTVTFTAEKARELEEGAEAGIAAKKDLAGMRADTAISNAVTKGHRMLNDEAKAIARTLLVANFEEGEKLLKSYPIMSAEMLKQAGDTGETSDAGDVKAFIDEKTKDGKVTPGQAMAEAREKFSAEQVKAYEFSGQAA